MPVWEIIAFIVIPLFLAICTGAVAVVKGTIWGVRYLVRLEERLKNTEKATKDTSESNQEISSTLMRVVEKITNEMGDMSERVSIIEYAQGMLPRQPRFEHRDAAYTDIEQGRERDHA